MFYGAVIAPGKPTAYVPPPEDWNLHLSQAALSADVPDGTRVSLLAKLREEEPVIIATLTAGKLDSVPLDLFFEEYVEFSVQGKSKVHVSGYYVPHEDDGEGEDEDDDGIMELEDGDLFGEGEEGGEGESDEDDDGMSDDEEDEDEDEEDEDESEDEGFGFSKAKKPEVHIEDITDKEPKKSLKALPAPEAKKHDDKKHDHKAKKGEPTPDAKADGKKRKAEADAQPDKPAKKQEQTPAGKPAKADGKPAATPEAKAASTPAAKPAAAPTPAGKEQPAAKTPATKGEAAKTPAKTPGSEDKAAAPSSSGKKNIRRWENGFEIEEVKLGNPNGKLAKAGKKVMVQYTGRLKSNGKVFDQSRGKPFAFRLGVGEVIKGWDAGVEGMRVGDKRRLVIPPQMAYGSAGVRGAIPPNATLEFDVELVDVK